MNIGIVTTWFERGAAYVSKNYMNLLKKEGDEVYIYARGGEQQAKNDSNWDLPNVTWNGKKNSFRISVKKLIKWINKNNIAIVLFNEQNDFRILAQIKTFSPKTIIGAYVDYYTERLLPLFNIYDFVLCNTKRHMQAMDNIEQRFYIKWGTDIKLFNEKNNKQKYDIKQYSSTHIAPERITCI